MEELKMIEEAVDYIKSQIKITPKVGLILGSGLGVLANEIENPIKISYHSIPNFPVSTVEGHEGQFVVGTLNGKEVIAMQGRFHFYEGYTQKQTTMPVLVMRGVGVETLLLTNAAGGVNETFKPGDLMLISDHINFSATNPLIGRNLESFGPRFPDMSQVYNRELIAGMEKEGADQGLKLRKGVYAYMTGPCYETPAEIKMVRKLGGDAVGMSTVPEAIVANHCGVKVVGISCITNMAAGILDQPLNHQEVMETAEKVKVSFIKYVKGLLGNVL